MKRIIYTRPDGGLSVVHPIINTYPERESVTEGEAVKRAWGKLPADAIDPQIVDESDIPVDRTFRNAWSRDGAKVIHDMAKARDIQRDRLRAERAPLLAALDIAYQRADEVGDAEGKTAIAAKKQVLRDITEHPDIDAAKSVDDLKAAAMTELR